jgi:alanyl-tRNA synthetase
MATVHRQRPLHAGCDNEDAFPLVQFLRSATQPLAASSDLEFNCGQILREALASLGLRGGGSADLAQGEVPAEQEVALRASISEAICKAMAKAHKQQ